LPPDLCPPSPLGGGDAGSACGGDSSSRSTVARPDQHRERVVEAFELGTETVAFLLQVFECRCEIGHAWILAAHGWCNNYHFNSSLQSVTKAFQSDIVTLLQIGQCGLPLLRAAFSS
jgi:hypothetical protein